ncbi:MAG: hypothetical protein Tsb005_20630 [Gammaproteobacteria bacterium]
MQNIITYHRELELIQPFLIECYAKAIPALEDFVSHLPKNDITEVRLNGLKMMARGISKVFAGVLLISYSDHSAIPLSYRKSLLVTLANNAKPFVNIMSLKTRKRFHIATERKLAKTPETLKPYVSTIADALNNKQSDLFCQILSENV